jgi:CRP-like cAMP-binding protein
MNDTTQPTLAPMVRKLQLWHPLSEADRRAVLDLPFVERELDAGQYIVWEGDRPQNACLLLSGFAYRHKLAGDGGRQILAIHMKGDLVDLQNSLLGIADHNVQMLSAGRVAMIPVEDMRDIAFACPAVGMAMWYETLVEGAIFREWIVNIGRRDALTRIAHLLCEISLRLDVAELGHQTEYELPISQEQLADAVSLTSVHVNRKLMELESGGLIKRTKRMIEVNDWPALARVGDFQSRYLHVHARKDPPLPAAPPGHLRAVPQPRPQPL